MCRVVHYATVALLALAPVAHHRLAHAEGERATAMGAAAADVCMMASTLSNCPLEAIAEAGGGHALRWSGVSRATTTRWLN